MRRHDWRTALRAYATGIEQHLQLGQPIPAEVMGAAIAFARLECYEPAAVFFALARTLWGRDLVPRFTVAGDLPTDLIDGAEDAIAAAFDSDQLARLKARGAALDLASAAVYLRGEVERILT